MKKIILFVLFTIIIKSSYSQLSNVVPKSLSVANAAVSDNERWSGFANPASLASVDKLAAGMQYENRYFLPELSTRSVDFALHSSIVNVGFSASYFGFSLYNEVLLGLGFARNFSDRFSMGVQFNYLAGYFYSEQRYRGMLFPQIGLTAALTPSVVVGFSTFNPFQSGIRTETASNYIPSVFSIGTTYIFSDDLLIRLQVDKEIKTYYRLAGGIEYDVFKSFVFKAGAYNADFFVPNLGFETKIYRFVLNLNCELHPTLGLVNAASVRYCIGD